MTHKVAGGAPELAGANRDEQMSKRWPLSLLNDERMSNCFFFFFFALAS